MPTIPVMRRETIKVEVDAVTAERALALADQGWMPVEVVHGDLAYWSMPNTPIANSLSYYSNLKDQTIRRQGLSNLINRTHAWVERESLLATEGEE